MENFQVYKDNEHEESPDRGNDGYDEDPVRDLDKSHGWLKTKIVWRVNAEGKGMEEGADGPCNCWYRWWVTLGNRIYRYLDKFCHRCCRLGNYGFVLFWWG